MGYADEDVENLQKYDDNQRELSETDTQLASTPTSGFEAYQKYQQALDNQIRWQLDQDPLLQNLKAELLGCEFDNRTETWAQVNKPLMNGAGIAKIMSMLRALVNTNSQLNNLRPHEIAVRCEQTAKQTIDLLEYYFLDFEIDEGDLDLIVDIVDNTVYLVLKRADGGGERDFLNKSVKVQQNLTQITTEDDKRKGGVFNFR